LYFPVNKSREYNPGRSGSGFCLPSYQWSATDYGVVGRSSGIGTRRKETKEDGVVWAKHCGQEIGNWGVFLPRLYDLYKVVTDPKRNPFTDLSVQGQGRAARYKFIK
jgi:hypothetical protein